MSRDALVGRRRTRPSPLGVIALTLALWAGGATLIHAQTPDKPVLAAAMSASAERLATTHFGGTLTLWDTRTLAPLASWTHSGGLSSLAVAPDAQTVAVAGPTPAPIALYGPRGEARGELAGPKGRVDALAFSPDGDLLAIAGAPQLPAGDSDKDARRYGPAVVLLHATSANPGAPPRATIPLGQTRVTGLAVLAEFIAVLTYDGQLTLYARSPEHAARVSHDLGRRGHALAVSPDGRRLAVVIDDRVMIVGDARPRLLPTTAPAQPAHVAWSPDASRVIVTGHEEVVTMPLAGDLVERLPCQGDTANPVAAWIGAGRRWVVGGRLVLIRAVAEGSDKEIARVAL